MNVQIKLANWSIPPDREYIDISAKMIFDSFKEFYSLISPNEEDVLTNIGHQLLDKNSELGYSIIIIIGGAFAGISVYYPSDEIKARQINSLRHIMCIQNRYANMIDLLKQFKMKVEPISFLRCIYWARLGVEIKFRQLGVANLLIAAMENDAKSKGYNSIGSHLYQKNIPSMKMHLSRGFSRITKENFDFIAMLKKLS